MILAFLVLADVLIDIVVALYLSIRLTQKAFLTYFDCVSIIPSTLCHLSALFTSLGIVGSFRLNNAIIAVN